MYHDPYGMNAAFQRLVEAVNAQREGQPTLTLPHVFAMGHELRTGDIEANLDTITAALASEAPSLDRR